MKHVIVPRLIILALLGSLLVHTSKRIKKYVGFTPADYDFLHKHGMKIDG